MATIRKAAPKLPIIFGGGIVSLALVGATAGLFGMAIPLAVEGLAALAGMAAGAHYA